MTLTLPCSHKVCVDCMRKLVAVPTTLESQQEHNEGNPMKNDIGRKCPICTRDFDKRDVRMQLRK